MIDSQSWFVLLPPLVTIIFALLFKEIVAALALGIFTGLCLYQGLSTDVFIQFLDVHLINAVTDSSHQYIILFTLFIGGAINLIQYGGGLNALINKVSKRINTRTKAELWTYILGVLIFFDDYANTLIVGNSMRPITDHHKISRAKLAYIVDSTSAPITSIAFISTWVGAELGYIAEVLPDVYHLSAQSIFLGSLKYAYYPLLTLVFVLIVILSKSDWGAMSVAQSNLSPNETEHDDVGSGAYRAIIPLVVLVVTTLITIYFTGTENGATNFREIVASSDSYKALLYGSFAAMCIALLLNYKSTLVETIEALVNGFKSMISPLVILVLAWVFSGVLNDLGTSQYIASLLSQNLSPSLLPLITFILAAVISLATGSSWGTMALLFPIIIPVAANSTDTEIILGATASVLGGAVFGDHCSPISDTTVLSSIATKCDHLEHVKTQVPYALFVGIITMICYLAAAIAMPWYLITLGGIALLLLGHKLLGKLF